MNPGNILDNLPEDIVDKLNNIIKESEASGIPVRFNNETTQPVCFYFNKEYGKIFVDKFFLK